MVPTRSIAAGAGAWLVRGGKKASHIDTLVRREVVAVSWVTVIGVTDLRDIDDEGILRCAAGAGRSDPQEDLHELRTFQHGLSDGDVVVMPDSPRGDVVIGVVAGPYDFSATPVAGDLLHRRKVDWLGRYRRELLAEDVRDRMDRHHRTVWRLPGQEAWLRVARDVAAGRGEPADKGRSRQVSRDVGALPSNRVCVNCGLMMGTARFEIGTDVCRDCAD